MLKAAKWREQGFFPTLLSSTTSWADSGALKFMTSGIMVLWLDSSSILGGLYINLFTPSKILLRPFIKCGQSQGPPHRAVMDMK